MASSLSSMASSDILFHGFVHDSSMASSDIFFHGFIHGSITASPDVLIHAFIHGSSTASSGATLHGFIHSRIMFSLNIRSMTSSMTAPWLHRTYGVVGSSTPMHLGSIGRSTQWFHTSLKSARRTSGQWIISPAERIMLLGYIRGPTMWCQGTVKLGEDRVTPSPNDIQSPAYLQ